MNELSEAVSGAERIITFEDPGRFDLPEEIVVEKIAPDAALIGAAWLSLAADEKARLVEIPPQPAYLKPPHITKAKSGHPLLRDS